MTPPPATIPQCVILAGRSHRPFEIVGDRPFLAWRMGEFLRFGVSDFVILCHPLPEETEAALRHAADALPKTVTMRFSEWRADANGSDALRHAAPLLAERFWLCDPDRFFDTNLATLLQDAASDGPEIVVRAMSRAGEDGPADAGLYACRRGSLELLPAEGAPEADLFARAKREAKLRSTTGTGRFIDIGIDEEFARARRSLAAVLDRPALFLDRDGVLNVNHGYVGTRDRWDWIPGALETIRLATDHGWHVFVVSNQSGVARGLYTEAAARGLMEWMTDQSRRHGGTIDDYRICPYHPEATIAAYRRDSAWRKPGPGMLLDLLNDWQVQPRHCLMIGDEAIDTQAAEAAGVRGVLFPGGNLADFARTVLPLSA